MTVKFTFAQLGYTDSELGDLILSLKVGSTKMNNGELIPIRYKLCYDPEDKETESAVKINGGYSAIVEFSKFLSGYKLEIGRWLAQAA